MMGHMFGYGYPGTFNWWWIIGFGIIRLLLFIGLIILVVKLINKNRRNSEFSYSSSKAVEILKEKYVLGEIDEEEYQRKLKTLKS